MNDFFIVFQEIFKQDFMIKALITGIFIAISCSLLGVFLVLKNMSLIGDGLAHVSFAAIAIGLLVSDKPIIISIPIVIVASFLVLLLKEKAKIDADIAGRIPFVPVIHPLWRKFQSLDRLWISCPIARKNAGWRLIPASLP